MKIQSDLKVSGPTHRDYSQLVPFEETAHIQLEPGEFRVEAQVAVFGDVIYAWNRFGPRSIAYFLAPEEYVAFVKPHRWRDTALFNGMEARKSSLFCSSSRYGYVIKGADREAFGFGIRRTALQQLIRDLYPASQDRLHIRDFHLELDEKSEARLHQLRYEVLAALARKGREPEGLHMARLADLSDSIVAYVAATAIESWIGTRNRASNREALKIVQRAQSHVIQAGMRRVSLLSMAEAAGVGQTSLNAAYHQICQASPGRLLRLQRLTRARELLLASEPGPNRVAAAAADCGFNSSGWFAGAYRSLFGEMPSETLKRQR